MTDSIARAFLRACEIRRPDSEVSDAESLLTWLQAADFPALDLPGQPFDLTFRFRGQRDARWGLTTSLYRAMLERDDVVREPPFGEQEQRVLEQMRQQGLGRNMSDGELLMVLQHHGVPTRLLDVSTEPLEALFFAVDAEDGLDGRLFLIGVRDPDQTLDMSGSERDPLPWAAWRRGRTQGTAEWTNRIYALPDVSLDPRMRAQRGVFLVGGLPRSYGGQTPYQYQNRRLRAEEVQRVTNLAIAFPARGAKKKATSADAVGWTLRVPAAWKGPVRELLAERNIRQDTMYPPFAECRRLGEYVARQPS